MAGDARRNAESDRHWFIVGRWREFEGEGRANLLRIVAVGVFYLVQLLHFYVLTDADQRDHRFQQQATAIAAVWSMIALGVLLCLRQRFFPAALKFVSTGCDIVLLILIAFIGEGPHSPMVFAFFLVIALAGLRFSLRLVWSATLGCVLAYVALVAAKDKTWFDADHVVPPVEQMIVLLSLALTGIIVGQIIRHGRVAAQEYAQRLRETE